MNVYIVMGYAVMGISNNIITYIISNNISGYLIL